MQFKLYYYITLKAPCITNQKVTTTKIDRRLLLETPPSLIRSLNVPLALLVHIHPCYEGIIYNPYIFVLICGVKTYSLSSVGVIRVISADNDQ